MRSSLALIALCALVTAAHGQDRHDWQSLSRLQAGGRVRLSLKNWTPAGVTVGTVTFRREDVRKIERYPHGGSRAKHAIFGTHLPTDSKETIYSSR